MKTCTKCGVEKKFSEFAKSSKGDANGLRAQCRACCSVYNVAWNKANRSSVNEAIRRYRKRSRHVANASKRKWNAANPEALQRHKATDYERHRESYIARADRWRKDNPEGKRAQSHKRRSLQANAAGAEYTTVDKIAARISLYGGRCVYCGGIGNSLDHRIPLARGGSHWPANLIPCCRSCNSRKSTRTETEFRAVLAGRG